MKVLILILVLVSCKPYQQPLKVHGLDGLTYTVNPVTDKADINKKEHQFAIIISSFLVILFAYDSI